MTPALQVRHGHAVRKKSVKTRHIRQTALVVCLLLAAGPAAAQDAESDWDLTTDPARQLTLATLNFGSNQIALRCKAGVLDLLVTGMPLTTAAFQTVRVTAGAIKDERQQWLTWPDRPIISPAEPERVARQLRAGGELDIRLEPATAGERPRRYRLPVPQSAASIDQVLSACSVPLNDDWDLRQRAELGTVLWARQLAPDFPELAASRGVESAEVRLGCAIASGGALDECRILSEAPQGAGFGRSALRAAERARVEPPDDEESLIGKVVTFTVRFRIS